MFKLLEAYTGALKGINCICKPVTYFEYVYQFRRLNGKLIRMYSEHLTLIYCPCCKYDKDGCLKDGNKCGISHVMRYWFCFKDCKALTKPKEPEKKDGNGHLNQ